MSDKYNSKLDDSIRTQHSNVSKTQGIWVTVASAHVVAALGSLIYAAICCNCIKSNNTKRRT